MLWKTAILTASDKGARGEREDTSAQVIRELVEEELGGEIIEYRIVPDEPDEIIAALIEMTDYFHADLVLTTGGTELAIRDVTPEATRRIIDREVPGMAEAMRSTVLQKNRAAMLFRGIVGIRGRTLIVNLPGTPKGVHENLAAIMDQLPEALLMVTGQFRQPDL
ncbi:MogA/MoaB family molybdenum cofactor biosynthesis protein [Paenibacillus urinalis]|uniref:MogA/MoaB family molybdenum cofactor biosynthesis protein n=3 Tax=Paenibacillus TaxID=44249 RepID=A0AAX3N258_9BACL|nr:MULTISPECIES: MogA/MoaB family molybdenum cofactor biosynthesis protein [Paenibacillus]MCM3127683.1 MogA/MoaB family molybdenum cofactor biosynthesis protein [Paenibacillus sp. MER 78]OMC71913.1 molybdenum cofactor biosynthesis protein [Paenibacillus sp. FSL H7-0326]WDH83816.1 MogA/MoaB family molybdenum cofactor biosynthesis protein [Paenibacillus urinalis]WDH95276.1 MogA/MoaB family molybdenum cofactor biosynthesis protein [Paenibacillus urinalis]WDI03471.1 MogA/MoaB family molybdenum cof